MNHQEHMGGVDAEAIQTLRGLLAEMRRLYLDPQDFGDIHGMLDEAYEIADQLRARVSGQRFRRCSMNHQEQTNALKQQFANLLAVIATTEALTPGSDAFRAANGRLDREGEYLNRAVQRIWRANKCAEIRQYGAEIKAAFGGTA